MQEWSTTRETGPLHSEKSSGRYKGSVIRSLYADPGTAGTCKASAWRSPEGPGSCHCQKHGFINARKHDSQDICFVPDGDYAKFIEKYTGKKTPEGDFVDKEGNYIGRHKGIIHYTIGQRRGLGIPAASRLYVCEISPKTNTVVLGDNADLFSSELEADSVNLISVDSLAEPKRVTAKIRYRHKEQPATAWQTPDGILHVKFDEPQKPSQKARL